jgi:hypothetical protein
MRLISLFGVAVLAVSTAAAGQSATPRSSSQHAATSATSSIDPSGQLPVSLDKIREALEKAPAEPLRGIDTQPNFSTQIREKQTIEELLATIKVPGGPVWPAGPYATELNRITNNPVDHPLTQPYAEFNQSELLAVAIENVVGQYFARSLYSTVRHAEHERAEQAARLEVMRAIAQYCAAQPQQGAGIPSCYDPGQVTGTR